MKHDMSRQFVDENDKVMLDEQQKPITLGKALIRAILADQDKAKIMENFELYSKIKSAVKHGKPINLTAEQVASLKKQVNIFGVLIAGQIIDALEGTVRTDEIEPEALPATVA
jgi:hypothetical protein